MKICSTCKVEKPEDEFYWKVKDVTRKGVCMLCHKSYRKKHYEDNREKYIQKAKDWTAANGGSIQQKYGLDTEALVVLQSKHDGLCWVCQETPGAVVDHDHACCSSATKTCGKCVRGWLCHPCNKGLGFFRDDPKRLHAAMDYLKR